MRLTPELEKMMNQAMKYARDHHHEFVSLEHMLLSLTEDPEGADIIHGCGGNISSLQKKLKKFLDEHATKIDALLPENTEKAGWKPSLTMAFHRVVQRALLQVESSGRDLVTSGHFLISLMQEKDSHAVFFLEQEGVTQFEAVQYFSHGIET